MRQLIYKMNETLTIIIPAFNESSRITKALNDIDSYISKISKPDLFQVIIVNDGSTDNTSGVVNGWIQNESKNKKCFQLTGYMPNRGKGYAVNLGFLKASNSIVLYTDADGAAPINEVQKLLEAIKSDYDAAIGSRVIKDKDTKVSMSFTRRLTGRVFHLVLSILGLASLKDTQCGFKLFRMDAAKKLAENQKCFGFSFDIEYLFLLKKFGYKIKEVPINWYHIEGSKVNIFRDSVKMLVEVLKIRFLYKYNITDSGIKG